MNVVFLANSYHLSKTKSADFFIDLLKKWFGTVTVVPHKEAWARLPGKSWDLLVSWQQLHGPSELEAFGAKVTVLVPMYDDCPKDEEFWSRYKGFKILCFSTTLGKALKSWGHNYLAVQYYQPVPEYQVEVDNNSLRGFFWPRTTKLTWCDIRPLLDGGPWTSFHLHDSNSGTQGSPSAEDRERFSLVESSWFSDGAEFQRVLSESSVFFAPRRSEGIGQAVLEALALGMCVVAPDAPTMNEYIQHGVNGLLFDPMLPMALDFSRAREMGMAARVDARKGRASWEASEQDVLGFLMDPSGQRGPKLHPWITFRGRSTAFLRAGYRILKKVVGRG